MHQAKERALKVGDKLFAGEILITGKGKIELEYQDGVLHVPAAQRCPYGSRAHWAGLCRPKRC